MTDKNEQEIINWLSGRKAAASLGHERKAFLRTRLLNGLGARDATSLGRLGPQGSIRRVRAMVSIAIALVIAFAATFSASASALPGDLLYGLKLGIEDYRLSVTDNPVARSVYLSELIETRLGELEQLAVRGDSMGLNTSAQRLVLHLSGASYSVDSLPLDAAIAHSQVVLLELSGELPEGTEQGLQQALNAIVPVPELATPQAAPQVTETSAPEGNVPESDNPSSESEEVAQSTGNTSYTLPVSEEGGTPAGASGQATPDESTPAGHPPQMPPGQSGGSNNGTGSPGQGNGQGNGNGSQNAGSGNNSSDSETTDNPGGNGPEDNPGNARGGNSQALENPGEGNKKDKSGQD